MIQLTLLTALGLGLGLVILSVVADRVYQFTRKKLAVSKDPVNTLLEINEIAAKNVDTEKMLDLYQKEWQIVVETQMHFNDLILRFRSTTLSVLAALIGGAITLVKAVPNLNISESIIYGIPGIFWLSAFIIDFFYYHRLLLGAVAQAKKFDQSKLFKEFGLGGITTCIKNHVHLPTSRLLIIVYYLTPVTTGLLLFGVQ